MQTLQQAGLVGGAHEVFVVASRISLLPPSKTLAELPSRPTALQARPSHASLHSLCLLLFILASCWRSRLVPGHRLDTAELTDRYRCGPLLGVILMIVVFCLLSECVVFYLIVGGSPSSGVPPLGGSP